MPSARRSARRALAGTAGLAVALTGVSVVAPSASAVSTSLVISEVYGGGGNSGATWKSDFIEIHNPTGSAVSVDGWSVQWRGASSTSAANVTPLSGSVPANGYYLVKQADGTGGTRPLPTPDATGTIAMGGTNGTAILANTIVAQNPAAGPFSGSAAVVDLVGVNSNTFETTAAPAMSNSQSVTRTAPDADNNSTEFAPGTPSPTNALGETEGFAAEDPGDRSVVVDRPIQPIQLSVGGGTAPLTWEATGLPAGLSLDGDRITGTATATGTATVTLTVTDSSTPAKSDTETFTITVTPAGQLRAIADIQGANATISPIIGQSLTARGVVTAVYETGGFNGFNIQAPGPVSTPGASDGIFVYGGAGFEDYPEIGDSVEVVGNAAEYESAAGGVTASLTQVTNAQWIPVTPALGTVTPLVTPWFATPEEREAHEGELVDPSDAAYTVTNSYATWQFGEIGLATGTGPLVQPTEVEDFQTGAWEALRDQNAARLVTLDDGKSQNFGGTASGTPSSWIDASHPVRAGAAATLKGSFVVDHRNGLYKLQPTTPVEGLGTDVAEFANTRTQNAAPADVGGDIRIATFNVLNYFPTTGQAYVAAGGGNVCTYFNDRAGTPIGSNQCGNPSASSGNGPRGAATQVSFERQQAKIVAAINKLTASVVSLEELENSVKFGKDRDDAIAKLVTALNADAGAGTWSYVPSPAAADLPLPAQEDVIRTGFIYKSADVTPVGASLVLKDEENFDNAREPLAQAFKKAGAPDSEAFGVIVNHFKSKGDSTPPATGDNANGVQGAFNGDRVRQAGALLTFADAFRSARGVEALFLAGDFNSYSKEDPVQVIEAGGYAQVESDTEGEETYFFNGLAGSLDHVYANEAAQALVTGADIWNINSPESVAFQYGRFNYNVTQFFAPDQFGASDHDPEIVGLDLTTDPLPAGLAVSNVSGTYGKRVAVKVTVDPTATGTVQVKAGTRVLGVAAVSGGTATVVLPARSLAPGRTTLTASYSGDDTYAAASASFIATVAKARSVTRGTVKPKKVVADRTRATIVVRVAGADGVRATGKARITVKGQGTRTVTVRNGRAMLRLKKFGSRGAKRVTIQYLGSDLLERSTDKLTIKVRKR
ncbi:MULTISPECIES: ExeM/NucH family extracellular endonuclease [unclassified Nocardioides]|uniref:ExeM/NucH family extracellular endonuclease n=1 Tax=unclassified Nocardioides TaxID=2615069 RepID=UPI00301537E5